MGNADILKPLTGLISSAFIDYIEYKFPSYIEDIDNNQVIEVNVIFEVESESAK
jgi:hypothetical protein